MKPKIKKFGCEIEAEMSEELMNKLVDMNYGEIVSDGSINSCMGANARKNHCSGKRLVPMEFVSKPMDFNRTGKKQAKEIFQLLNEYYKRKEFHWNTTMGFHVHISFRPKTPVDIWSLEFAKFFKEKFEKTFKTVFRLRKDNRFCKIILGEKEIATTSDRYRFINYKPAFKKHGTVEFRIFPANRPKTMRKYLKFVFQMIKEFLKDSDKFLDRTLEFIPEDEKSKEFEVELITNEKKQRKQISQKVKDTKEELTLE